MPETIAKVWPSGWVCQNVRAPGSKRTQPARSNAGSGAWMIGSCHTVPVKLDAGPRRDGRDPQAMMSMMVFSRVALFSGYHFLQRPACVGGRLVDAERLVVGARRDQHTFLVVAIVEHADAIFIQANDQRIGRRHLVEPHVAAVAIDHAGYFVAAIAVARGMQQPLVA